MDEFLANDCLLLSLKDAFLLFKSYIVETIDLTICILEKFIGLFMLPR